jgi:hypothetical protein
MRLVVAIVLIVTIGSLLVAGVFVVRHAQHAAKLCSAYGRLCQMRLALQMYESQYGTLPPLCVRNRQGKPIHSWRALMVPCIEFESLKRLDLSQSWDSQYNRGVAESIPPGAWTWWARDIPIGQPPVSTCIVALLGRDSIWDAKTGLPKGTLQRNPDAILLISMPESDIHPLEPRDITEEEVRTLIGDNKEVLFIRARTEYDYGVVKLEDDKLLFRSWQELHD